MPANAEAESPTRRCPECGAVLGEYAKCEELFHRALIIEWEVPGAGEAHHLLVGTYMLQHPSGLTEEGRAAYRELISSIVDEEMSAPETRERIRGRFDQDKRGWTFKTKHRARPVLREWPLTIADAITGPGEELPERVWRWARAAREELRKG